MVVHGCGNRSSGQVLDRTLEWQAWFATMMDPNDELVSVLVPKRYVLKIYAYLAKFDAVGTDDIENQGDDSPLPGGTVGASAGGKATPWTLDDLRRLAGTNSPTTTLVSQMLDVLAARKEEKIGND